MLSSEKKRGPFWASITNTANNNRQSTTQYIYRTCCRKKASSNPKSQDQSLRAELENANSDAPTTAQLNIMKKIRKRFPFMDIITQIIENGDPKATPKRPGKPVSPKQFSEIFFGFAELLEHLRNCFTHSEHSAQIFLQPDQAANLGGVFKACVNCAKERFSLNDKDLLPFRKYNGVNRETRKPAENPKFKFDLCSKTADGKLDLTQQGLAFLMALFLEKDQINQMLDSEDFISWTTSGFGKSNQDKLLVLVKRVYSICSIRLPRPRLECTEQMTDQTLGLDILSELHKCPAAVFDLISLTDQEKFRETSERTQQETLYKRFQSRFPYLALSFLDRKECLPGIRFCIHMGNFYCRCHERRVIDGSVLEDRRIPKRILWFQRMQDAVAYYKTERVKPGTLYHIPSLFEVPPDVYRSDMFPQYDINGSLIALRVLDRNGTSCPHPTLDPEGKATHRNLKPSCWLSLYELPVMLFLAAKNQGHEVDRLIRDYTRDWKDFLHALDGAEIRNPEDMRALLKGLLDERRLPEEFQYYMKYGTIKPAYKHALSESKTTLWTYEDVAKDWIKKQCEKTERTLESLARDSKYSYKIGKKRRPKFHPGFIARWLVRDFMFLQQSNGDEKSKWGKIKSAPDYMALQTMLTCFDMHTNKERIETICKAARLVDGERIDHPFLQQVLDAPNSLLSLTQFFKAYLNARKQWLESIPKTRNFNAVYPLRHVLKRFQEKQRFLANPDSGTISQYFHIMAQKLLEEPVNLPRGLFTDALRNYIKKAFPAQWDTLQLAGGKDKETDTNATWLMMKYLEWSSDEPQWFYHLPYAETSDTFGKLFTLLGNTNPRYDKNGEKELKKALERTRSERRQALKRLRCKDLNEALAQQDQAFLHKLSQYGECQKGIRHEQMQDIALLCTLPALFGETSSPVQLKDVRPSRDSSSILNQPAKLEMTIEDLASELKLQKVDPATCPDMVRPIKIQGEMKRKNYGNFLRMRSDFRLPSYLRLMNAFGETVVTYEQIREEFSDFERVRREIQERVEQLEQAVLAQLEPAEIEKLKDGKGYVDFATTAFRAADEETAVILIILRNAMAHSYFPEFLVPKNYTAENAAKYAPIFASVREELQRIWREDSRCVKNGQDRDQLKQYRLLTRAVEILATKAFADVLQKIQPK